MKISVLKFSEMPKTQWRKAKRLKSRPNHESYIKTFTEEFDKYCIDRYCVISEMEGSVLGWVVFESYAHFFDTNSYEDTERIHIYVSQKWRGKGIGEKLLDATLKFAKIRKIKISGFHNKYSEKLYKKYGVLNIF